MSYFDDASLVMIPSGYKTSKVYSVKPTSGDGDLTFTRSNDTATRVGPDGLIEKVRTNLITYSQDFSNAAWVTNNSTKTTSQTDPNSGTTAVKIVSTANVNSGIYQTKTASSTTRTASLWMKGETGGEVVEYGDATNRATATLTTSWVRYSFAATDASAFFVIYNQTSAPAIQTWYVAFVQYETGDIATNYIATTSAAVSVGPVANVPRLDYLNSSCPRLLLEPTATTLMPYSESLDNAAWDKTSGGAAITANSVTSPDGYTNADTITGTGASVAFVLIRQTITVPSAATYTFSGFFKYNNHPFVSLNLSAYDGGGSAYYNIQTGVVGTVSAGASATITNYGNGWYRCTLTAAIGASDLTGRPLIYVAYQDGTSDFPTTAAATGKAAYAWGINLTQSAYATSYIPTLGAAVTRGADAASKTGISSLIGQTEGTLFVDVNITKLVNSEAIGTINSGGYANNVTINRVNAIIQFVRNSATQSGASVVTSSAITTGRHKMAIAYKSGDTAFFLDGVQVSTTQTQTFTNGTLSVLAITGDAIGAIPFSDSYNQALLFPTRLTNAQLAELTA